jgi:hypothetical protein
MTKVVNLRSVRKRAERLKDEKRAAERRTLFGKPKVARLLVKAQGAKAKRDLDGHRIGNGEGR